MQKITEIKETHTVKRKEKVNGEDVYVEKTFQRLREVPVVEGTARFGHFILDRIFYYLFTLILGTILGVVIVFTGIDINPDSQEFKIYDTLLSWLILQPLFYFIFEASMQSSPAKAILGRIVVDEYGNKPTVKQFFIRSISRSVPFEDFSCLSPRGWHDTWSNTFVIRKKDLNELRLLQKINNIGPLEGNKEL
ncbi:MAG: RDD family protein [Bacteroidetes bacterium]|nr:RDD family protein [Bacteroidota bacterium]